MRVLVLGATGNVGAEVERAAVAAGHQVRSVSRRPRTAPPGVEPVVADLDDAATLVDALDGVDAVFTLAGYGGLAALLERGRAAGLERVVLLSSSSAPSGRTSNPIARYHIESERIIRDSGLHWTFLQPNAFMSNALRWLPQLERGDEVREPFGEIPASVIAPADIAEVAVLAMATDDHAGATYRLSGPESLPAQARLDVLGAALGRDLRFVPMSPEETLEHLRSGMPEQYVQAMLEFYRDGLIDESTVLPTVAELLGRPPTTFAQWTAANAPRFRTATAR